MMWQPNTEEATRVLHREFVTNGAYSYETGVRAVLSMSGALSEINRLTALLAMKDETIKTLRTQLHMATATFADDYDSGYRAA